MNAEEACPLPYLAHTCCKVLFTHAGQHLYQGPGGHYDKSDRGSRNNNLYNAVLSLVPGDLLGWLKPSQDIQG